MMKELENKIEKVNSMQKTENGAVGYSTTRNELVDLNFKVPSFRNGVPEESLVKFDTAMENDLTYAVKWMFFLRDAREGLGERRAFAEFFSRFYMYDNEKATRVVGLIGEYGCWRDVFDIIGYGYGTGLKRMCFDLVKRQLKEDADNFSAGKGVSLLAKWIPSINASDKARHMAIELKDYLGLSNKEYRKMLSNLRARIGVVETMTCGNRWGEIDYEKVPSKANIRYKDAFLKHDGGRRREFLDAVLHGEGDNRPKMNASVLFPHEIWHKYRSQNTTPSRYNYSKITTDESLEALWMNLKDTGDGGDTMVVCDGSGSMTNTIGKTKVEAIDVSRSLSVYFAERCRGEFKNRFIEFSATPEFIDISGCKTLADKIKHVSEYTDMTNTDIEKVFMLILEAAKEHGMKQSDLPGRILIISDMEFDDATTHNRWDGSFQSRMKTLFDNISDRYAAAGYKMPKLVFWNVNSRTNTIPVTENELGVALVSGFSANIVKMVMSGQADPWLALKETLDSERYSLVDKMLGKEN